MAIRKRAFNRGRWQLERERCQITEHRPPDEFHEPAPLGQVVQGLVAILDRYRSHWAADIETDWADVVGSALAAHTRPGGVRERELLIYVRNPIWLNEIRRRHRADLLSRLQTRYGAHHVGSIRLELDPGAA